MCNFSFEIPCQFAWGAVSVTAAHFPWFWGITWCLLSEVQWFLVSLAGCLLTALRFQVPALQYSSWRQMPGLPGTWYKARVRGSHLGHPFPRMPTSPPAPKSTYSEVGAPSKPTFVASLFGDHLSFIFSSCLISIFQIFLIVFIIYGPSCFPTLFGI